MNLREAGIEQDEKIKELCERIDETRREMGIDNPLIVSINNSPLYNNLKPAMVKVVGNPGASRMTSIMCDCGCKINTDGKIFWCSGISCNFYGREETF